MKKPFLNYISELFGYSKSESRGVLLLLIIMIGAVLILLFQRYTYSSPKPLLITIDSSQTTYNTELQLEKSTIYSQSIQLKSLYNKIDINTISKSQLDTLEVPTKLANTLCNYLDKGGKIKTESDLKKIYGMNDEVYHLLINNSVWSTNKELYRNANSQTKSKNEEQTQILIDINTADTTQLKKIKGIGSTLANRIIKYRNKLGGFVNKNQLNEVYGISEFGIKELHKHVFIVNNFTPKKININKDDFKTLVAHPYIGYEKSKVIFNFLRKNKKISSLEELNNLNQFTENEVSKLSPYLEF